VEGAAASVALLACCAFAYVMQACALLGRIRFSCASAETLVKTSVGCQYVYFCTGKGSKLSTCGWVEVGVAGGCHVRDSFVVAAACGLQCLQSIRKIFGAQTQRLHVVLSGVFCLLSFCFCSVVLPVMCTSGRLQCLHLSCLFSFGLRFLRGQEEGTEA
jgi:hypothetical protein